jgi:histone H3/H4
MSKVQKLAIKKKKSRFFEIYIPKILKNISDTNGITNNAKQQFNSVLCFVTKIISSKAYELTILANKKTISEKEVRNTLKFILPENLSLSCVNHADNAMESFSNNNKKVKGMSRQEKSCIIFPPSIIERFLRNFGFNKIMVTSNAPIFLAGAIEHIASEILENATIQARDKKHIRITVRDLELGVRNDRYLNKFFIDNKVSFLGGGVVPYIHPNLLVKKPRKRVVVSEPTDEKKKHRYRPGTVSIREIKKLQKNSNILTFAKFPFEKLIRKTVSNYTDDQIKISKDVFITVQYFIEQQIVDLLQQANFAAIHAGRVKLVASDINFILNIKKYNCNPLTNDSSSLLEINNSILSATLPQIDEDTEEEDVEEDDEDDEDDEEEDDEDDEDVEDEDEDVEDDEDEDEDEDVEDDEDDEDEDVEEEENVEEDK